MNVRRVRILSWLIAAACGLAGALLLALAILVPLEHPSTDGVNPSPTRTRTAQVGGPQLTMAQFDPLMAGRLRPPPPPPPAPAPAPIVEAAPVAAPPAPAAPGVQLLGTVV